jgi:putative oxidoreductase
MDQPNPPPAGEPRLLFPALEGFYTYARDLSWLVIRLAVGGTLLVHGIVKLNGRGVEAFAQGLAQRGIEPALPFGYSVFFLETVGAICIMVGLFTRFFGAAIAIELLVVTFVAHYGNGYSWSGPKGGWEYPFLWGWMFFAIALRGGGPYSVDRRIGREL